MKNQMITGVGCFASPEKLSRVFLRMMQTYTLGELEGIESMKGCEAGQSKGANLLMALIAGKFARQDSSFPLADDKIENRKITGFFLSLKDHSLQLSIFAKNDNHRQEIHSAVLDGFTKIRHRRLN